MPVTEKGERLGVLDLKEPGHPRLKKAVEENADDMDKSGVVAVDRESFEMVPLVRRG